MRTIELFINLMCGFKEHEDPNVVAKIKEILGTDDQPRSSLPVTRLTRCATPSKNP